VVIVDPLLGPVADELSDVPVADVAVRGESDDVEVVDEDAGVDPDDVVEADVSDAEPESGLSATATGGLLATAIPTPNATASPPTRPMYFA
jgi:hypothetical protein